MASLSPVYITSPLANILSIKLSSLPRIKPFKALQSKSAIDSARSSLTEVSKKEETRAQ